MGFFDNLFNKKRGSTVLLQPRKPSEIAAQRAIEPVTPLPSVVDDYTPDMLSLGWYYSEGKQQFQMAKIPHKDRSIHMYVIGASGSGKTKFLEFPIQQDISLGHGFCIIDPHGDLVEETKGFLAAYYQRTNDQRIFDRVVIVDPTDPRYTVGFNVLETPEGVAPIEQAQELIMVFKRLWASSWGARMEELMRNALISLSLAGLTLAHLTEFLTSQPFRSQVMAKVNHPIAKPYFQRFDTMSRAAQLQWSDPVTNKVNAFLSDERISQMLSAPKSTINLRDIMDRRKILLIKLNKGKLRESSDLLGSLFMAKIQLAAFSRTDIPESTRVPFYLYIDEFQNFASETFGVVLSEARKYGLSLIMAHQTLDQIPTELRSIILGNTGIQVYFRTNRTDAQLLAKEAFTYDGYNVKTIQMRGNRMDTKFWSLGEEWERNFAKLQSLPARNCFIKHKIEGGMLPLETEDIKPAHEVLGINPEEYPNFLNSLPFGKKYLLDRSAVTQTNQLSLDAAHGDTPLGDEQQTFLEYIVANPDTAISSVYKGLSVSVRKGNELRDSLKAKGLLEELEVRIGTSGAGRTAKCVIPTLAALELLGKEPPTGRGGAIHRHIQHLVEEGASVKGFTAKCEYDLGNGGIVDVHLENEEVKIAVEIAAMSKPQREIAHIRHCLAFGYDKVFDVFVDQRLLERTQEAMMGQFSDEERGRVQLVPLSKLSAVVEGK